MIDRYYFYYGNVIPTSEKISGVIKHTSCFEDGHAVLDGIAECIGHELDDIDLTSLSRV